jgi:hypothetical protein
MKRTNVGYFAAVAAAAMVLTLAKADDAFALKRLTKAYAMPAQVNGKVLMSGCTNAGGPVITLDGTLDLGGLSTDLIFRNNVKGTHERVESVSHGVLVGLGTAMTLPKQPVFGGVGGNPHIWMQLLADNNTPLSDAVYLGRCVQGAVGVNPAFLLAALATTNVEADGCKNSGGPWITLSGDLTLSGVKARFLFSNADNNVGGPHQANGVGELSLVIAGTGIKFPKSPHQGGAGGNPLISLQFLQGSGDPIEGEIFLGRCNKI